jgi:lipopolysaccharide export system permease protein
MFFIGAPLGSIIRKGGLGLPIVFAVSIFIAYHFVNTFGIKLAEENQIIPILGVFLSTLILTPLALFLTYRAINDIGGMVSFDRLFDPIKNTLVFKKINAFISKYNSSEQQINLITPIEVSYPKELIENYIKTSKYTMLFYAVSMLLFIAFAVLNITLLLTVSALSLIPLFYFVYKSQNTIAQIEFKTKQIIEPGIFISILVSFPFYIFIHLYTKKELDKLDSEISK